MRGGAGGGDYWCWDHQLRTSTSGIAVVISRHPIPRRCPAGLLAVVSVRTERSRFQQRQRATFKNQKRTPWPGRLGSVRLRDASVKDPA